jgi:CIC family chloride channel protein
VATTRGLFGGEPVLRVMPFALESYWECLTYGTLGLLLGLLAVIYTRLFHAALRTAPRLPWPRGVTLLLGLAAVGVLDMAVPANLADGYPVINDALAGRIVWQAAVVLAVAKMAGSIVSLACGAPGGVFGPIFFIGAMTGAGFRAFSALILPGLTGPRGSYALVGLGAFLAATTHAPLTSVFLLFEMTDNYSVTVPALVTVGLALLVAQHFEPESIDTYGLSAEGKQLHGTPAHHALDHVPVRAAYRPDVVTVPEGCPLPDVLRIVGDAGATTLPVVNGAGELVGLLSFAALREALLNDGLGPLVVARDLCESRVPTLTPETSLSEAFRRIEAARVEELPVVDPAHPTHVIGMLSRADLIAAYNRVAATLGAPATSWLTAERPGWSLRYRVITIEVPQGWARRSLREIDCRGHYGVAVLAVRPVGRQGEGGFELPDPDRPLSPGDALVVAGIPEDLRRIGVEA